MNRTSCILIYDVGKTNKKLLLFDEQYNVVFENSRQLEETVDEDGFACEDLGKLTEWVFSSFLMLLKDKRYQIKAVNFSGYGASLVYLDENLQVIPPLYNYLKPLDAAIKKQFYDTYGGESRFSKQAASPVLGNLNAGMQLYRLKYEQPEKFKRIHTALHLSQYLSFVLTSALYADLTNIGCHSNLWDFHRGDYHHWVSNEGVAEKLPPVLPAQTVAGYVNKTIPAGAGLHDSSAALIPYLFSFKDPFVLISTGTWCISLNPFNHTPITDHELAQDCLCFLSYEGKRVKASRLFAGYEHEQQVKRLAAFFNKDEHYYTTMQPNLELLNRIKSTAVDYRDNNTDKSRTAGNRDLSKFSSYEHAYHQLMADIVAAQIRSTNLVLSGTKTKRIFVDGGFSKNAIYMYLLADAYPALEVYAASVPQASALGAAFIFHQHWNSRPLPSHIINIKLYSVSHDTSI